jgi:hypothetical protein
VLASGKHAMLSTRAAPSVAADVRGSRLGGGPARAYRALRTELTRE